MTDFYRLNKDSTILCTACARGCNISPREVGFCGVRYNNCGKLDLLNYGKLVFLKKDGDVLLVGSLGSNMRLSFDMDWDTGLYPYIQAKEIGREKTNEYVKGLGYSFNPQELVRYAKKKNCQKIIFQFNEPLVYLEYISEVIKQKEVEVGLVSTGYFSQEFFESILPHISSLDVLFFSTFSKFYFKHGRVQLSKIVENIERLHREEASFRLIYPLIEGENDSEENILSFVKFLADISKEIPVVFKRYHPSYRMVDKGLTTKASLEKAKGLALKNGLLNVILDY